MRLDRRRFLELGVGLLAGLDLGSSSVAPSPSLTVRIHRATRNTPGGAIGRSLWGLVARPAPLKTYPGRPRRALPPPGGEDGPGLFDLVRDFRSARTLAETPVSLATLARLLHLTNGVTTTAPPLLRAAPSAGALYAGEVYVVASRVAGLEPGVYAYHVPAHQLVPLSAGARVDRVAASLESPGAVARAPFAILLTNVFARYSHRYANRGYRYALIDSGHIGENLRLAAAGEGLSVVSPLRFEDDVLNRLLGIDGREEAVCALFALGREAALGGEAPAADASARSGLIEAQHAPDATPDPDADYPQAYHAATRLVRGEAGGARASGPAPEHYAPPDPFVALPAREPPAAGLAFAIRTRRSARRFLADPLPLADLALLLDLAQRDRRAEHSPWIALRVFAHRVDGLPPGLYAYDSGSHALTAVHLGDLRERLLHACPQPKATSAAAGFAMLGDLASAAATGDRAYRDLLIEAGAIGQRLYLGAEALGHAARNLAAFLDDRLNELLRAPAGWQAVHLTMVGPGD